MKEIDIKLTENDIAIIFQHLKKGSWEEVNDTINKIYLQKQEQQQVKEIEIKEVNKTN